MTFNLDIRSRRSSGRTDWDDTLLTLYESHYLSLCATARRVVGSASVAEDIVQEAFLRYQANSSRPTPGRELAYLRSIILNSARSLVRHREVARRYVDTYKQPHVSGSSEWIGVIGLELILRAIGTLPTRQREVVVHRMVLDRSECETAAALGISPGAVKVHLSRARAALRLQIEPWFLSQAS